MCFPIFFAHYGNSILLEIVWINASHKICKKPIAYLYNVCVFLYLSLIMRIHLSYVFGIVCISASRKVCKKHLTFWHLNVLFFYTFPIGNNYLHVLGKILLMWRFTKNFHFRSHFHSNLYAKLFTKEINLYCFWAQSSTGISNPFAIEIWNIYSTEE